MWPLPLIFKFRHSFFPPTISNLNSLLFGIVEGETLTTSNWSIFHIKPHNRDTHSRVLPIIEERNYGLHMTWYHGILDTSSRNFRYIIDIDNIHINIFYQLGTIWKIHLIYLLWQLVTMHNYSFWETTCDL